jgi:F-type H+-transporting ATPase subunit b
MEALGRFGLQPWMFLAQVVNFLVIAFVIQRFLLSPLMANIKARRHKIAVGLENAERASRLLAEAGSEREKILREASAESSRILTAARDEAEHLRAAAMQRAGVDAERLIAEARGIMALERQEMEKAVQGLSLQLSGRILERSLEGLFTDDEKSRIVARGLERIGRMGRS